MTLVKGTRNLPPVGGIALALGSAAGLLHWQLLGGGRWTTELTCVLLAGGLIFTLGLIDDFVRELSPWQKVVGQAAAWLFLVRGGIIIRIVYLPGWANLLVALLWTLTIVNAFNLLDVVDGLAIGIAVLAAATFFLITAMTHQTAISWGLAILCGALGGVLLFNFPRARLFLGDSGSMLAGLWLAAVAVLISYAPLGREVALLTPLLVLGLPVYDLVFVMIVRARQGRSVFRKSRDHFVFRLIQQGCSPVQAAMAMFGLCLAFSLTALIVNLASNPIGFLTVGGVVAFTLWWGVRMARVRMDA